MSPKGGCVEMWKLLCVGAGGFLGSVCRYLLGLLPVGTSGGFPVKTWCINILGAFVIGMVTTIAARNQARDSGWTLFLKAGVCGGFTTFSTFAFETADLLQRGSTGTALVYALSSMVLGVLAVFAASWLFRA